MTLVEIRIAQHEACIPASVFVSAPRAKTTLAISPSLYMDLNDGLNQPVGNLSFFSLAQLWQQSAVSLYRCTLSPCVLSEPQSLGLPDPIVRSLMNRQPNKKTHSSQKLPCHAGAVYGG